MAAVMRAGVICGKMMRRKISPLPQPSISAASSISRGMPRMNCMIMKMKNAVPPMRGRSSGQNVLIHPNWLKTMYCGMICTCTGSISVASMAANQKSLPLNWMRAKP